MVDSFNSRMSARGQERGEIEKSADDHHRRAERNGAELRPGQGPKTGPAREIKHGPKGPVGYVRG